MRYTDRMKDAESCWKFIRKPHDLKISDRQGAPDNKGTASKLCESQDSNDYLFSILKGDQDLPPINGPASKTINVLFDNMGRKQTLVDMRHT